MASGAGYLAKDGRDLDAFLSTEVELAKAKRQYASLEKRLEEERSEFSKDYRRLNQQLLEEREKSSALQARVFELEAELHKERITRLGNEEEESAKRRVLEEELRRNKSKYESHMAVLEEELRSTKEVWAARLSDERKTWQIKAVEKAESLQTQIDQTRDYYKGQVEQLHRELGDLLSTHRSVKEELELAQAQLRDEKRKKKLIKLELDEAKEKYRRCLNLASDLVALRKSRSFATSLTDYTTARPLSASPALRDDSEAALLRKQLKLTQELLDSELLRNRELREELSHARV
jgi:chromosome segregation ATPase